MQRTGASRADGRFASGRGHERTPIRPIGGLVACATTAQIDPARHGTHARGRRSSRHGPGDARMRKTSARVFVPAKLTTRSRDSYGVAIHRAAHAVERRTRQREAHYRVVATQTAGSILRERQQGRYSAGPCAETAAPARPSRHREPAARHERAGLAPLSAGRRSAGSRRSERQRQLAADVSIRRPRCRPRRLPRLSPR